MMQDNISFYTQTLPQTAPYHIEFLRSELGRRKARNSAFSMRAFARMLEIHPSALSRILNGSQALSVQSCAIILRKIQFSDDERRLFINSFASERTQSLLRTLVEGLTPTPRATGDFTHLPFGAS